MGKLNNIHIFLIFLIFASRLLPHPPNFTPVLAIFSLGGHYTLLPALLVYMMTDLFLGWHNFMIWVYGSLFLIAYLQRGPIVSSVIFFVVTNFGVWTSGWYGYDLQGLITCYIMAIPFFANTLTSTVLFYIILNYAIKNTNIKTFNNLAGYYITFVRQSRT